MRFHFFIPVMLILGIATGCTKNSDEGGTTRVNGSIHVLAGQQNGNVDTVNGAISVDEKATFGNADTVNGDIFIGAHASGTAAKTVNGNITLDSGARIAGEIASVNGLLTLNDGAEVTGPLGNINGGISLTSAHAAKGIVTVNGDISIIGTSKVEGGLRVKTLSVGVLSYDKSEPRIIIGPGAAVQGELKFERKVKLYVSDKASIGPVSGATPIAFSGDTPPP
jgi:DUF4097 and DUF4098 domain-containing protein YvlB